MGKRQGLAFCEGVGQAAAARHHHRPLGDAERPIRGPPVRRLPGDVVHGDGPRQDHARAEDGPAADDPDEEVFKKKSAASREPAGTDRHRNPAPGDARQVRFGIIAVR